jgi:hypothetical protein
MSYCTRFSDHLYNNYKLTTTPLCKAKILIKIEEVARIFLAILAAIFILIYSAIQALKKDYGDLSKGYSLKIEKKIHNLKDKDEFFGEIEINQDNRPLAPKMKAIAILASHLKIKHNLENLFVIEDKKSLIDLLMEIKRHKAPYKASIILPLYNISLVKDVNPWQHKLTVGIEKSEENQYNIINFDSQTSSKSYSVLEPIITSIFGESALFKEPNYNREISYGCGVFALRDAVSFLKNSNFFEEITFCKPEGILLPSSFMKGTQSLKLINTYFSKYEKKELLPPLKKSLKKHERKVKGKLQNHYITNRMNKYQRLILDYIHKFQKNREDLNLFIKEVYKYTPIETV